MRNFIRTIVLIGTLSLTACPRGETKTLSDVYTISKERFVAVKSAPVPAAVTQPLIDIDTHLEKLSGQEGEGAAKTASELEALLSPLTVRAGYPSRPAMGEIISQYRMLSQVGTEVKNPQVKLLAARTYSLLASELETTRFSVE